MLLFLIQTLALLVAFVSNSRRQSKPIWSQRVLPVIIIFITSDGSCRGKKTGRGSDIESNMTLKVTHVGSSPNISLFCFFCEFRSRDSAWGVFFGHYVKLSSSLFLFWVFVYFLVDKMTAQVGRMLLFSVGGRGGLGVWHKKVPYSHSREHSDIFKRNPHTSHL